MRTILLLLLFQTFLLQFAMGQEVFKSDVKTEKKPWTNLDFYNDPQNFQFAIVSDRTGASRKGVFKDAVEKLNLLYPEFVLSVGDLIQGYTKDLEQIKFEWQEFNTIISGLHVPFFYLPGNHDISNLVMQEEWKKRYGRRYYYFTYKDVLFITMDSNDDDDYSITTRQRDFVMRTLKNFPQARWTFLFMHHPIWKYDTNQRFQEIEKALAGRPHTIIAGHEHHYHHEAREHANYYILATTGGGSQMRGPGFGEFDHITWVTMTENGPVMANLQLDGIWPHDVSNNETRKLASSLLANTSFRHLIACNQGDNFENGTAYLHFTNSAERPLNINLKFYHHHQINLKESLFDIAVAAQSDTILEIPLKTDQPVSYDKLGDAQIDWAMTFNDPKHPHVFLDGRYDFKITPSEPGTILPQIPYFTESIKVSFRSPYPLKTRYTVDGSEPDIESTILRPVSVNESSTIRVRQFNDKGEATATTEKPFKKLDFMDAVQIDQLQNGLLYSYFKGDWPFVPDFVDEKIFDSGIALDFNMLDYVDQEDMFGLRYEGYVDIKESGLYIFWIRADDAARLYIHDQLVYDEQLSDEMKRDVGLIALQKGYHPIRIHYIEYQNDQYLQLYSRQLDEKNWNAVEFEQFYYIKR